MEQAKDYLVSVTNFEGELQGGKLFLIEEMTLEKGQTIIDCKRRDVNVKRNPGNYLLNSIKGQPNYTGKEELDKKRRALFREENIIVLGNNSPRTYLAFPDHFENLPASIKNHPKWGVLFQIVYEGTEKIRSELETMKNKNMSESEMFNQLTQSTEIFFEGQVDKLVKLSGLTNNGNNKQLPPADPKNSKTEPMY